jgi:hypothetical protein
MLISDLTYLPLLTVKTRICNVISKILILDNKTAAMTTLGIWDILGIVAIICLLISFAIGRNAIWGGLTIGILVCIVIAIIALISNGSVNWSIIKDMLIVFVLLGALFETIGRLFSSRKSNN